MERDLQRTLPGGAMLTTEGVSGSLYRILRAYLNDDPELVYSQGMAFSAALLLAYMTEPRAFWAFHSLMKGKLRVRDLYVGDLDGLRKLNVVWVFLFKKKYPKIYQAVKALEIDEMFYTPSWFLAGFLNLEFPPLFRLRIMDRYVSFGTRASLSLGLAIVGLLRKELTTGTLETVLPLLQNPCHAEPLKDWRNVIIAWDKNFISKKDYDHMFTRIGVEYIP
jgi:hypothetical protein